MEPKNLRFSASDLLLLLFWDLDQWGDLGCGNVILCSNHPTATLQGGPHPQLSRASGRNKILLKRWTVDGGWWMVDGGWWMVDDEADGQQVRVG